MKQANIYPAEFQIHLMLSIQAHKYLIAKTLIALIQQYLPCHNFALYVCKYFISNIYYFHCLSEVTIYTKKCGDLFTAWFTLCKGKPQQQLEPSATLLQDVKIVSHVLWKIFQLHVHYYCSIEGQSDVK